MWRELCISVFCLLPYINGSCFHTYGRIDRTANGKEIAVCEYNGFDVLHGSSFTTAACTECYCYEGLLTCCGYGINGPKPDPPIGCKHVADGCEVLTVKNYDVNLDCYTGEPVVYTNSIQDFSNGRTDSGNDESDSTSAGSFTTDSTMTSDPYLSYSNVGNSIQNTYGGQTGSNEGMLGNLFFMSALVDLPFF